MNQILKFLIQYQYACLGVLFAIQMIMMMVAVIMIKKLNRHVNDIHHKVADYLEVVYAEEEKNEQPVAQHLISEQEKQMMNAILAKKKQQEEAVFNAVLHEIFP